MKSPFTVPTLATVKITNHPKQYLNGMHYVYRDAPDQMYVPISKKEYKEYMEKTDAKTNHDRRTPR